jgi:copper homeostasis protein (lipoprotein)
MQMSILICYFIQIIKMKIPFTFYLILLFFYSCKSIPEKSTIEDNGQNIYGEYNGVLPCADCDGIQTKIRINKDETFEIEKTYLGNSTNTIHSKGSFSWNQPGAAITLTDENKKTPLLYLAIGDNKLIQLDLKGNMISNRISEKYVLYKNENTISDKYWQLVEINGKSIDNMNEANKAPYIVLKKDGKITGKGTCNSFFATYILSDSNQIIISKLGSTEMWCDQMDIEKVFFNSLQKVSRYILNDDSLILKIAFDSSMKFVVYNKAVK